MKQQKELGRSLSKSERQNITSGIGGPCMTDADCPPGLICVNGFCQSEGGEGCSISVKCKTGELTVSCNGSDCKTRYCKNEDGGADYSFVVAVICDNNITRCVEDSICGSRGYIDV